METISQNSFVRSANLSCQVQLMIFKKLDVLTQILKKLYVFSSISENDGQRDKIRNLFNVEYRKTSRSHPNHVKNAEKSNTKQNTGCTGNQSRIKKCKSFNFLSLEQYVKGVQSCHASKDVRTATLSAFMGSIQLRTKTQRGINQASHVFSENPMIIQIPLGLSHWVSCPFRLACRSDFLSTYH